MVKPIWASILLLLLFMPPARAEYCWMVGCVGDIGYVFVPWNQQNAADTVTYNRVSLPNARSVFREPGIPPVNSTVAIAVQTPLLFQHDLEDHLAEFREPRLKNDPATGKEELEDAVLPPGLGNPMKPGATVRILGYRTYAAQNGTNGQLLFALVQVVSDEAKP